MHACTRSAKQKYGSIYIFLDENVSENGCLYIYIYIYRQVLEVRQWGQLLTGPTRFNNVSAVQPSSDKI